jgi:hypothetical protein
MVPTVKSEKGVQRLYARNGSFDDFKNADIDGKATTTKYGSGGIVQDNNTLGSSGLPSYRNRARLPSTPERTIIESDLWTENEALRQQIEELESEVNTLRYYSDQSRVQQGDTTKTKTASSTTSSTAPGVVLELMRPSAPLNCHKGNGLQQSKEHQSFATDDDQSTIGPTMDWDVHKSASGLKHRYSLPLESLKPARRRVPNRRKGRAFEDDDGSFSISAEEVFVDEEVGGMNLQSRQPRLRPKTSSSSSTRSSRSSEKRPDNNRGLLDEGSFWRSATDRAGWLVGLLMMQSMSSFILARNEALLQKHLVIVRFLTMLVGAGGNAGNQASVRGECLVTVLQYCTTAVL